MAQARAWYDCGKMRDGLPRSVYWLLTFLFLLAAASTVFWAFLYARDSMIAEEPLVAGRFGTGASLRLTASCFAALALTSGGLLFGHYKRADHYGSPLEVFYRVAFGFSCAMAIICFLPSLG